MRQEDLKKERTQVSLGKDPLEFRIRYYDNCYGPQTVKFATIPPKGWSDLTPDEVAFLIDVGMFCVQLQIGNGPVLMDVWTRNRRFRNGVVYRQLCTPTVERALSYLRTPARVMNKRTPKVDSVVARLYPDVRRHVLRKLIKNAYREVANG